MSISSEITRINGNIADAYDAVGDKGGTLPSVQNSANLPAAIESIPSGGGTLITKTITQNGTYNASADNADGYSQVTVDVSGGGGITDLSGTSWSFETITLQNISAFMNGMDSIEMLSLNPLTFSYMFNERTSTTEIGHIRMTNTRIELAGQDNLEWNGSWVLFGNPISNVSIMNIPPSPINTSKVLISFLETVGTRIE